MPDDELTSVRPAPNVLFQELEGETVLLHMGTERYYGLNEVGTRFWQLLTEHGSTQAALNQMLMEFEVDEPTLRADLARLLSELAAARLVIVQD